MQLPEDLETQGTNTAQIREWSVDSQRQKERREMKGKWNLQKEEEEKKWYHSTTDLEPKISKF